MSSSSVLRRYTPPTCTLEVAAIGSALSRWTDQAVLKNLRFELSFDDPTQNEADQVTIRGDRNQLEALWEAVSGYVHKMLLSSGEGLAPIDRLPALGASNGTETERTEPPDSLDRLYDAGIKLQPQGWLTHELHLGTLANAESTRIPLTTLQLFDLANALDEYHAEALTLPSLGRPRWLKAVPNPWMKAAAAAVVLVGISVPMVKFITDLSQPQIASAPLTKDVEISTAPRAGDLPAPASPGQTPPPLALTPLKPAAPPPVGTTVFPAPVPATVPDAPAVPVTPAQPSTIVIPAEPDFPAIPDNPSVDPSSVAAAPPLTEPATPPRLEGTDEDFAAGTTARSPDNLADALAAAESAVPNAGATARSASPTAPASNNQAEEAKTYFQQNWQPPEGLTESLEYRLLLNTDGSLQRILPLGRASENFLDRTNMPLLGESFVSPTVDGKKPQIRVVLEPDGNVQTFLEYAD
jgi:hypothetical protein